MTWYLIIALSYSCPGGLLSGLWPAQAKPFICQSNPTQYIETKADQALKRVRESEKPRIWKCKNLKCSELDIETTVSINVEGL